MEKNTQIKLLNHFKSRSPERILDVEDKVSASVVLLLKYINQKFHLLFIKRSEHPHDYYSGHVAFPGGKKKVEDIDLVKTAVRETYEEVGINLDKVGSLIGVLDDIKPFNRRGKNFVVTPYVFFLNENVEPVINEEVETFLWIPVDYFNDKEKMRIRYKERDGVMIEDYIFEFDKFIIWGMTGRILNTFVSETSDYF